MKRIFITAALISLLLSACCPMVSENPLSDPAAPDQRLEGLWQSGTGQDEEVYLHIGRQSEDNTMVALSVEHKDDGTLDTMEIPFFLTRTDAGDYMNLRLEDLSGEAPDTNGGYVFIKYVLPAENTLLMFSLDREPVISAIRENRLEGEITYKRTDTPVETTGEGSHSGRRIDCVTITDSSENLLSFIEASGSAWRTSDAMTFFKVDH
jgi:hypothetical protein